MNIKNLKIKYKLLLGIVVLTLLGFLSITVYVFIETRNLVTKNTMDKSKLISESYTNQVINKINTAVQKAKTLAQIMENYQQFPPELRRPYYDKIQRKLLASNPDVNGVWCSWGNASIDNLDLLNLHRQADSMSGEYGPFFFRSNEGIQKIEDYDYFVDTLEAARIPLKTGKLYLSNPYFDPDAKKWLISLVYPIKDAQGATLGVAGIDYSLNQLLELTNSIKPFVKGLALLFPIMEQLLLIQIKHTGVNLLKMRE